MSIKIMAEVWDNAPCTGGELLFLLALADQAGDYDRCAWPGMRQLMRRTRSSRRSVYNYAAALREKRIIAQVDPDEASKKIPRYLGSGHGGHSTSIWRIRPMKEWASLWDVSGETDQVVEWGAELAPEESSTSTTRGASSARSGVQPVAQDSSTTTTTSRKNNSSTTSKSRSSQRASARRGDEMADPVDSVFAKEQDDEADTINPRGGPDSAWGLNKYYRDAVQVAGNGFLGNTNDKAMRGFFAKAKRQGIKPDVLRAMVDAFVTDDRLFTKATGGARWRVFIANAETLRQRVVIAKSTGRAADFSKVPEFGGSIPQHILDEILAEAG